MTDNDQLKKYVEGFKDGLREASATLQNNEHKDWGIEQYGTLFDESSKAVEIRQDANKGFDEGRKDALATVGQDLHDNEFKEYSVEDYGRLYENIVKQIGDCLNCQDIGSDKGCEVGKTIWCTRLLETLKE